MIASLYEVYRIDLQQLTSSFLYSRTLSAETLACLEYIWQNSDPVWLHRAPLIVWTISPGGDGGVLDTVGWPSSSEDLVL